MDKIQEELEKIKAREAVKDALQKISDIDIEFDRRTPPDESA